MVVRLRCATGMMNAKKHFSIPVGKPLPELENLMSATVEEIETQALNLPVDQRARLIEKLIVSLDSESDVEQAWAAEVQRRHAEIESGAVALLPGAHTLAQLRAELL